MTAKVLLAAEIIKAARTIMVRMAGDMARMVTVRMIMARMAWVRTVMARMAWVRTAMVQTAMVRMAMARMDTARMATIRTATVTVLPDMAREARTMVPPTVRADSRRQALRLSKVILII